MTETRGLETIIDRKEGFGHQLGLGRSRDDGDWTGSFNTEESVNEVPDERSERDALPFKYFVDNGTSDNPTEAEVQAQSLALSRQQGLFVADIKSDQRYWRQHAKPAFSEWSTVPMTDWFIDNGDDTQNPALVADIDTTPLFQTFNNLPVIAVPSAKSFGFSSLLWDAVSPNQTAHTNFGTEAFEASDTQLIKIRFYVFYFLGTDFLVTTAGKGLSLGDAWSWDNNPFVDFPAGTFDLSDLDIQTGQLRTLETDWISVDTVGNVEALFIKGWLEHSNTGNEPLFIAAVRVKHMTTKAIVNPYYRNPDLAD